jgi:hypothetical protein
MDKLQKLLDIEDIKNLKHRYFRAIDMADFDLLDNIFTDDITVDYRGGTYRWESQGPKLRVNGISKIFFITLTTIQLPKELHCMRMCM